MAIISWAETGEYRACAGRAPSRGQKLKFVRAKAPTASMPIRVARSPFDLGISLPRLNGLACMFVLVACQLGQIITPVSLRALRRPASHALAIIVQIFLQKLFLYTLR